MPTRNIVLTDRQESLIEVLVQSGRYQNASEVLRDGLRLIEDREIEQARKIEALRAAAELGEGAIERGEYRDFSDTSAMIAYLDRLAEGVVGRAARK
jgi:antitoxin ParD1/3/4